MSVLDNGAALRKGLLGLTVTRATATLPATTQAAIFTISGGQVLVTGLIGTVTTATGATATTLQVVGNPTSGTDVNLSTAVSVASKEIGTIITLGTSVGGALSVQNAGGGALPLGTGFVLNAGTLDLVTSATNTGSVKWTLTYVPIDSGASVTAA